MSIPVNVFLGNIQRIVDTRPTYELGQDGSSGSCDCIGLIIGAVRRSGGKWNGTHGSNWAARNKMTSLMSPTPLETGGIVYKAHSPGETGYALPSTYAGHADQRDYYHVGVITGIAPLRVTHCTGGGIKVDEKIGAWRFGGRLQGIDYNIEDKPMEDPEMAIVTAKTGKTVRMRASPNLKAVAVANIPIGAAVEVVQKDTDWWNIRYGQRDGWMLAEYLGGERDTIQIPRTEWDALVSAFDRARNAVS